jgi:hypothetical protein
MRWPFRVLCALALTAGMRAQDPQVPETNPFTSDADISRRCALPDPLLLIAMGRSVKEAAAPI